jgi:hypothetical protein
MREQQVNSKKKILIAPFLLLARHIKAEIGSEVPKFGFREYIF